MSAPASARKRKKAPLQQARLTDLNQTPRPPRPSPSLTPAKTPSLKSRQSSINQFLVPVSNEDKENGSVDPTPRKKRKTSTQTKLGLSTPARTPSQKSKPFSTADIDHDDEILCLGSQQPSDFNKTQKMGQVPTPKQTPRPANDGFVKPTWKDSPSQMRKAAAVPQGTTKPTRFSMKTSVIHIDGNEDSPPAQVKNSFESQNTRVKEQAGLAGKSRRKVIQSSQWYENLDSQSAATQSPIEISSSPSDSDENLGNAALGGSSNQVRPTGTVPTLPPVGECTIYNLPGKIDPKPHIYVPSTTADAAVQVGADLHPGNHIVKAEEELGQDLSSVQLKEEHGGDTSMIPVKAEDCEYLISSDDMEDDELFDFEPLSAPVATASEVLKLAAASPPSTPQGYTRATQVRFRSTPVEHSAPRDVSSEAASYSDAGKSRVSAPLARTTVIYSSDGEEDDEDCLEDSIPETQFPKSTQLSQRKAIPHRDDFDEDGTPYYTFRPDAFSRELKERTDDLPPAIRRPTMNEDLFIPYTQGVEDDWDGAEEVPADEGDDLEVKEEAVLDTQLPPPQKKGSFGDDSSVTLSQLLPESLLESFPLPSSFPPSSGQLEETQ